MEISFQLYGLRDKVVASLTEAATDSPETQIRAALADELLRRYDDDRSVHIAVSITVED